MLAHICACIFITVANGAAPQITWIDKLKDVTQIENLTNMEIYVSALYWSIITMVTLGYGDIVPISQSEKQFVLVVAFIACGLFSYSFNLIGEMFNESRKSINKIQNDLEMLNNLMEERDLNKDLRRKVRIYFEYLYSEKNKNLEFGQELITDLPTALKDEVMSDLYTKIFKTLPLFSRNFSDQFISELSLNMKELKIGPELIIQKKNSVQDKLYFILKGKVNLFWAQGNSASPIKELKVNTFIGIQEFFEQSPIQFYSKSESVTELCFITYEEFIETLTKYPIDYEKYYQIKDKLNIYKSSLLYDLSCSFCHKSCHYLCECSLLNYQPSMDKLLFSYKYSEKQMQERLKLPNRLKKPKFNALKIINQSILQEQEVLQSIEPLQQQSSKNNNSSRPRESLVEFDISEAESESSDELQIDTARITQQGKQILEEKRNTCCETPYTPPQRKQSNDFQVEQNKIAPSTNFLRFSNKRFSKIESDQIKEVDPLKGEKDKKIKPFSFNKTQTLQEFSIYSQNLIGFPFKDKKTTPISEKHQGLKLIPISEATDYEKIEQTNISSHHQEEQEEEEDQGLMQKTCLSDKRKRKKQLFRQNTEQSDDRSGSANQMIQIKPKKQMERMSLQNFPFMINIKAKSENYISQSLNQQEQNEIQEQEQEYDDQYQDQNSLISEIEKEIFMIMDFDVQENFLFYFPHNNLKNVLKLKEQYRKKHLEKKKKKKRTKGNKKGTGRSKFGGELPKNN